MAGIGVAIERAQQGEDVQATAAMNRNRDDNFDQVI